MKLAINKAINKKSDIIEYELEILECIRENPSGVTITDISKEKKFSRNTVSKYVTVLEVKEKVFRKKIGAYNIYFSTEKTYFPKEIILSYYKSILSGLKENFPDSEEIFKQIGKKSLEFIDFSFGQTILKGLRGLRGNPILKLYFKVFSEFYPSYDILQPSIEISEPRFNKTGTKAYYRFTNSEFVENSDDFIYHFYIVTGIIEALWERELEKQVACNVENVYVSDKVGESFVELSIEVK